MVKYVICRLNFMLVTGWDLNINSALLDPPVAQPASCSSVYYILHVGSAVKKCSFFFALFQSTAANTVLPKRTINFASYDVSAKGSKSRAEAEPFAAHWPKTYMRVRETGEGAKLRMAVSWWVVSGVVDLGWFNHYKSLMPQNNSTVGRSVCLRSIAPLLSTLEINHHPKRY